TVANTPARAIHHIDTRFSTRSADSCMDEGYATGDAAASSGSVLAGVGAEREGALGAAPALDGVVGHHRVEEAVAAAGVGGAQVSPVGRGAERPPPVGDVAPAGCGERAAELLHGQRRAQRAEAEPLLERPRSEERRVGEEGGSGWAPSSCEAK